MKIYFVLTSFLFLLFSCNNNHEPVEKELTLTGISTTYVNSSIRALEVIDDHNIWFAGSKGKFGFSKDAGITWTVDSIKTDTIVPHFRAIAHHDDAIFLLSIESPALLYRTEDEGKNWEIVYREEHPAAFYDAMTFWDNKEGIAMGDPTDGCLSIIITRDGGNSWTKLLCDLLPPSAEGEAAFAASNSNIAVQGQHAWIATGGKKSRIFHTADRGRTWEVFDTPIIQDAQMTGVFSLDFKDENNGIIFGGDWEKMELNTKNKAITKDGGKTWQLVDGGDTPGYRSCVRYFPDSKNNAIMAVGIPGVSYSPDGGQHWRTFSDEPFYTLRFGSKKNVAFVAGSEKIGRIEFAPVGINSNAK
ncbi:MAG: photosystem II stability/assembly factor-like uncharacterized protein [Patescibacteria group bacterium]|jgi:photosystem II stability/assembly factor-like uncharacterized protein